MGSLLQLSSALRFAPLNANLWLQLNKRKPCLGRKEKKKKVKLEKGSLTNPSSMSFFRRKGFLRGGEYSGNKIFSRRPPPKSCLFLYRQNI